MTDIVDKKTRSRMMSHIRGKDTKPELVLRTALHKRGLRYRLHVQGLPGKPDLVFPRYRAVIFVNGCFWHRHSGCRYASVPSSNSEFWKEKFEQNVTRDRYNRKMLLEAGYRVLVVWECETRANCLDQLVERVVHWLAGSNDVL